MITPNGRVCLPVRPCFPGNLVPVPESLTNHLTAIELRLRALEEAIKRGRPQDDAELTHQSPGSLWNQMYEDAAEFTGGCSDVTGKDGAAMIRAVAAWIEKWAGSNQIDTEQLLRALDAEAQAAKQAGIDAVKGG